MTEYIIKNIDTNQYFSKFDFGKILFVEENDPEIRVFDNKTYVDSVFDNMVKTHPELNLKLISKS